PRLGSSFSAAPQAGATADFWSLLVNAQTSDQLCQAWLGILCQWIPGTQAGVLLLHDEGDRYAPAAVWPDQERDMSHLASAAQEALTERHGVVRDESSGMAQCAYPLLGADTAYGVVVLHVVAHGEIGMRDALRLLHWGAGWLVGLFDKRHLVDRDRRLNRSALLQDILLGAIAERQESESGRWIVNRLAEALPCRIAMLARARGAAGASAELISISGSAGFEARANQLAAAREALQEALASGEMQCYPPVGVDGSGHTLLTDALADYCREAHAGGALALPLVYQGRKLGALLVESDAPIDADTRGFLQTFALALAPCIDVQRTAGRGLLEHARSSAGDALRALIEPRYPGFKLIAGLALVALVAAALFQTTFRVYAPATVEGQLQRMVVAPFEGYIAAADVRAGDTVHAGDVLARMDDRELKLEEAKAVADNDLADRKLREAMSQDDAVAVRIAQADTAQASAELALVRGRLSRAAITAPFDGRIVKGDLSQQLGAPVEQGRVLFEIAPMHAWRVVLQVDERDIVHLRDGQRGELVLAGLPGNHFGIRVSKISPVAQAEAGHNSFRVEAKLQGGGSDIEPGMEGVGKVQAGKRSLLWIAFHRLFYWARYTAWTIGL
ncbi:MAG TPA: efflux RND transporter periplasmic adaptor subunit, partial [Candidatus Binataceae bacterium]|nr:efflux RND transporter periplasmic adaptor subunit [Candidatus Binataceae bacterium]